MVSCFRCNATLKTNEQMITKNLLKMRQKEAVPDFSQELMHSLAYRPDLGSVFIPQNVWSFLKSSRNVICSLKRRKSNNNSF